MPSMTQDAPTPLRRIRKDRGLTQTQLARLTGLDQRHISRLEAGRVQHPGHCTVMAVCRTLKLAPEQIAEFRCD